MFNRWLVREDYFGKFDATRIICTCRSINDCAYVIDGLVKLNAGRPFIYFAEKCSSDYNDWLDDLVQDLLTEECDFTKYVNGIHCINIKGGD